MHFSDCFIVLIVAIRASGFNYLLIGVFHGGNTGSNPVGDANPPF